MKQKLRKPVAWLLTMAMVLGMIPDLGLTALASESDDLCLHCENTEKSVDSINAFLDHLRGMNKSSATITRMLASVRSYYQYLSRSILSTPP